MAEDFDLPPAYDVLIKEQPLHMSDVWIDFWGRYFDILNEYLSKYGIFIPQLTTEQRNTITNPQNGQMIYNTSINQAQYFRNGSWSSF